MFARYFYDVLGAQALGVVPFGIDYTGYANFPLGAKNVDKAIEAFALPFRLLAPWRGSGRARLHGRVGAPPSPTTASSRTLDLGRWTAT